MAKILIIDDSLFTLKVHAQYVKELNHEPFTAQSGKQGIEEFLRIEPQVVLCDLMMPDMDGIEVFKNICSAKQSACFYLVTADIQETTKQQALSMGVKGFIAKPVKKEKLQEVLGNAS